MLPITLFSLLPCLTFGTPRVPRRLDHVDAAVSRGGMLIVLLEHLERRLPFRLPVARPLERVVRAPGLVPADIHREREVQVLSRRGRPCAPGTVRRGGHLYLPTCRLDPEAVAMFIDGRAHLGWGPSSSRAKDTLAALRLPLERRRSRTSWLML
jgi:hypothetical protein